MRTIFEDFVAPNPNGFHVNRVLDFVRNCVLSSSLIIGGMKLWGKPLFLSELIAAIACLTGGVLFLANFIWVMNAWGTSLDDAKKPTSRFGKALVFVFVLLVGYCIFAILLTTFHSVITAK